MNLYKARMIREAETKAKYYEAMATITTDKQAAHNYYRGAKIQLIRLRNLLSHKS